MSPSETLSLRLPADLAEAMREAVAAGEYASIDDAAADALAAWSHRHDDRAEELAWVKAKIRASLLDPRPSLSMKEVRSHLDEVARRAKERDDEAA